MKRKDSRMIRRRDFLISTAGLAGVAVPGVGWAAAKPCPPPSLSVSGGTARADACTTRIGILPAFQLNSPAASGTYAWTVGHAFRQGDVPAGSYVTSDASSTQCDVRNFWPDGSVKFAVISGISAFQQNQPSAVVLSTTTTSPASGNVAEPSDVDAEVVFSGGVTGTCSLRSVLGVNKEAWGSRVAGGRVRKFLGPVMSEFHYFVPTSDAHVCVWFYVRRYVTGATEVETVVENGWLMWRARARRLLRIGDRRWVGAVLRCFEPSAPYALVSGRLDWCRSGHHAGARCGLPAGYETGAELRLHESVGGRVVWPGNRGQSGAVRAGQFSREHGRRGRQGQPSASLGGSLLH